MSVNTTEKVIFVVNDMVYGSTVRINHHRASHPHVSLVVITADAGSDLDGFKAVFDGCEFGLVSDLQKPASRRVAQKVMPVKLFSPSICRIGACSDLDWRDDDDDVMIDPSAGGIYLLRKDINGVFDGSKDVKFYTVLRYARQAGILDLVKTPVYGLTKAAERAFLAAGHPWRNVADVVMEAAKKEMGDPKMQFAMAAQEEILALHAPCYGLLRCRDSLAQLAGCLSEGHPLRTFGIEYNIAWGKQNSEEVNSLAHLCKSLGMAFRRDKSETLLSQWESLERSYPMLCSLRHSVVAVKHLSDYVCWVDEQQRHVPAVQAA